MGGEARSPGTAISPQETTVRAGVGPDASPPRPTFAACADALGEGRSSLLSPPPGAAYRPPPASPQLVLKSASLWGAETPRTAGLEEGSATARVLVGRLFPLILDLDERQLSSSESESEDDASDSSLPFLLA